MSVVIFVKVGLTIYLICLQSVTSTEVLFERASIDYFNKKYISNATVTVRRTGRRSPYYINVDGTTLAGAGDNVSIHAVFYEFLHNEYKRSFVEIDINLCDVTNKEPWHSLLGAGLMARGFVCPAPPGTYRFHNLTISMMNFPYVWPFEKIMLQGYAQLTSTQEILLRAKCYATLKRDIPKGK